MWLFVEHNQEIAESENINNILIIPRRATYLIYQQLSLINWFKCEGVAGKLNYKAKQFQMPLLITKLTPDSMSPKSCNSFQCI